MIRLLQPSDAEQYYALRLEALQENPEAFATSYEEVIRNKDAIKQYEKSFAQKNFYTFGAFEDEKLIGMITLLPESKEKLKHKANIFAMYVTPSFREKGIGYGLLDAAIKKARELDRIISINLTVVSINHGAKALYNKFGFQTFGLEERALKINNVYFDEEYMTLSLDKE
ncbi:GNAT family N-acetyltransferase [Ornithinibacillus halotolerans]|uniref:Acetyltransferase n=1 Tax=Ornithinibacillus halotolerans TaxID=1274357 RepID=A0A916WCB6_9BACI|nr:GNAT family N-acetyltransferase [Ornithinibacillus halotolerans]GGA85116.1 acetyltransferase [Ornithinibacillus halotolerans]